MLPLKLVRSLVTTINNPFLASQSQSHHRHDDPDLDSDDLDPDTPRTSLRRRRRRRPSKSKTPFLLFVPTRELVADTYRLAAIARDMGMDLYPTPSLSHIVFSYPSPIPSPSSSSSTAETKSFPSSWSSVSALPNDAVPLPFPSLSAAASIAHLRSFAAISRGLFKLVFVGSDHLGSDPREREPTFDGARNWDCCSFSLFSRVTGDRIGSMDGFSRALAGMGWTLFKTAKNPSPGGRNQIHLFRKVDSRRVRVVRIDGDGGAVAGECRVRELRLPPLDFRNAPLRILQYIVLMTDDVFYLA